MKQPSKGRFESAVGPAPAEAQEGEEGLWFVCQAGKILVRPPAPGADPSGAVLPEGCGAEGLGLPVSGRRLLGRLDGRACWVAEAGLGEQAPAGLEFQGLRGLLSLLPEKLFTLAGRACQVLDWDRNHRFCGRCGTPTEEDAEDGAKRCPSCGFQSYARISPAVIVAVTRGERLLLASNRRFAAAPASALFSVLAGFVDPGESLEECVHREIREEVGLEVTNLRYFGSQPWPFPNSLMIAFSAEHEAGEIVVNTRELIEARWFTAGELPRVPDCGTIARRLIDWFARGRRE